MQGGASSLNKAAPGLPNGQAYPLPQGQAMPPPTSMAQPQSRNLHLQVQQLQHILTTGTENYALCFNHAVLHNRIPYSLQLSLLLQ